jgi:hypothetical protein
MMIAIINVYQAKNQSGIVSTYTRSFAERPSSEEGPPDFLEI